MPTFTETSLGCCEFFFPSPLSFAHYFVAQQESRENDITDVLDLTFSTEDNRFGETVTIDLKPGGQEIEVTNGNKNEYVE